jgi:hypothetical protein
MAQLNPFGDCRIIPCAEKLPWTVIAYFPAKKPGRTALPLWPTVTGSMLLSVKIIWWMRRGTCCSAAPNRNTVLPPCR